MMDWDDLKLFHASCQAGTLSAGAEALGISQATMSRRIAALEERVGHRLFDRTRDGLRPTAAAELLQPHAELMAATARRAAAELQGHEAQVRGVVRLAVPPGVAVDLMPHLLPILRRRHPDLRLEILADLALRDLDRREADVAIRAVRPERGDLVFRRMPNVQYDVFASPTYLNTLPKGWKPEDLEWITWASEVRSPLDHAIAHLLVAKPAAASTNSYLAMHAMARAGLGCVLSHQPQAGMAGLVRVPGVITEHPELPWYVVTHQALRQLPRVAAVVDFIDEVFRKSVGCTTWPPPSLQ